MPPCAVAIVVFTCMVDCWPLRGAGQATIKSLFAKAAKKQENATRRGDADAVVLDDGPAVEDAAAAGAQRHK